MKHQEDLVMVFTKYSGRSPFWTGFRNAVDFFRISNKITSLQALPVFGNRKSGRTKSPQKRKSCESLVCEDEFVFCFAPVQLYDVCEGLYSITWHPLHVFHSIPACLLKCHCGTKNNSCCSSPCINHHKPT